MNETQTSPCEPAQKPAFPPFQFGNPQDGTSIAMTPGNSAPALIVWMFIVSSTVMQDRFLRGGFAALPMECICKATNLTEDGVRTILGPFLTDKDFQDACGLIAATFNGTGGYEHGNCVTADTIIHLALHGASVEPGTKDAPSYT